MDLNHPLKNLERYNIILCSQSPRRKLLLEGLNLNFTVLVRDGIEENYPENLSKTEIPEYLSELKSKAYTDLLEDENNLIITSDTIVWLNNKVIGKPFSKNDAKKILNELSGNMHEVISGVTISTKKLKQVFHTITRVWFRKISNSEIEFYLEKYKPYDKAGAYGIQEWIGYAAVERIEGSFHNVMGLPVQQLYKELQKF